MIEKQNEFIFELEGIIQQRLTDRPEDSYTVGLVNSGIGQVAKKLVEESSELAIASVEQKDSKEISHEAADLIYHFLVLLSTVGLSINDVSKELENRHNRTSNTDN